MIRVIRIDGTELLLNADLIRKVEDGEQGKSTVITLINGERIEVKNPPVDIQVKTYARRVGMEEEARKKDEIEEAGEEKETADLRDKRETREPGGTRDSTDTKETQEDQV